jgi:hypothetical protein
MQENRFFKRVMNLEAQMLAMSPNKAKELIPEMLEYGTDLRQSLFKGGSPEFAKYVNMLNFNYGVQEVGLFLSGGGPK